MWLVSLDITSDVVINSIDMMYECLEYFKDKSICENPKDFAACTLL
mgnify:FL=1